MKNEGESRTYTEVELADMLVKMRAASNAYYTAACSTGVHPFIEFAGLMNEYIKICEHNMNDGIDFTETSVHTGRTLHIHEHEVAYIGEKFGCIFGPSLKKHWGLFTKEVLG